MVLINNITLVLSSLIGISLIILLVFQIGKNRYNCAEDGCKISAFGNFKDKETCQKVCKSETETNVNLNHKLDNDILDNNLDNNDISDNNLDNNDILDNNLDNNDILVNDSSNVFKIDEILDTDKINNNLVAININNNNLKNIKEQIKNKQKSIPYFATTKQAKSVITDYDTFPYPRYFRGNPKSSVPIVAEREAGWRIRHDNAYVPKVHLELTPECVIGPQF